MKIDLIPNTEDRIKSLFACEFNDILDGLFMMIRNLQITDYQVSLNLVLDVVEVIAYWLQARE